MTSTLNDTTLVSSLGLDPNAEPVAIHDEAACQRVRVVFAEANEGLDLACEITRLVLAAQKAEREQRPELGRLNRQAAYALLIQLLLEPAGTLEGIARKLSAMNLLCGDPAHPGDAHLRAICAAVARLDLTNNPHLMNKTSH